MTLDRRPLVIAFYLCRVELNVQCSQSICPQVQTSLSGLLFVRGASHFDNDVIIKLGRAARLWNGPSLRGHKWRNGARFQNKIKMVRKQTQNKLADGVLNRLYGK